MKQYTKPLRITRLETHTNESLNSNRDGKAAKRGTAGGLSIRRPSIKVHDISVTNPLQEKVDDFLDISFKEWEQWLNDYELKSAQRVLKKNHSYTPIEWPEDDSHTASHNKEAISLDNGNTS